MLECCILVEPCSTGTFTCKVKNWSCAMAKESLGKSCDFERHFLPLPLSCLPLLKAGDSWPLRCPVSVWPCGLWLLRITALPLPHALEAASHLTVCARGFMAVLSPNTCSSHRGGKKKSPVGAWKKEKGCQHLLLLKRHLGPLLKVSRCLQVLIGTQRDFPKPTLLKVFKH